MVYYTKYFVWKRPENFIINEHKSKFGTLWSQQVAEQSTVMLSILLFSFLVDVILISNSENR